jgi:large subunit ribosomal protein L29
MDAKEIRELTLEELDLEVERTREELFNLKFRASFEELENPALIGKLRRDVARLLTIRREREMEAAGEADA